MCRVGAYSVSVLGSILYLRILDHRVLVFNPSKFAAPSGPAIFPLAFGDGHLDMVYDDRVKRGEGISA